MAYRLQPEPCDWSQLPESKSTHPPAAHLLTVLHSLDHIRILDGHVRIVFAALNTAQNIRFYHWPQCFAVGGPRYALLQSLTIRITQVWL